MCVLLFFAGINYSGIRSSVNYNNVTTVIEVLACFEHCFNVTENIALNKT